MNSGFRIISNVILFLFLTSLLIAQEENGKDDTTDKLIQNKFQSLNHRLDQLEKAVDDLLWYQKVGDVAVIDKLFIVGPPPSKIKNPNAKGAKNPVKFWTYVFIPRNLDQASLIRWLF